MISSAWGRCACVGSLAAWQTAPRAAAATIRRIKFRIRFTALQYRLCAKSFNEKSRKSKSGPRMGLLVSALQALRGDMGINLCRGQVRVAQQLLHAAQIRPGVQNVRGEAVPQFV